MITAGLRERVGMRVVALGGLVIAAVACPSAAVAGDSPAAPAPGPAVRLAHPQVTMAGFSREYRPVPCDTSEAAAAIRAALDGPFPRPLDFRETPLRAVLDEFAKVPGLALGVDVTALADAGIDLDAATVTARLAGLSTRAALRGVLGESGLTWFVADEMLMVTTRERAAERPAVVAYPVPRAFGDCRPPDVGALIDLVVSSVAVETWDTVGGFGSIRPLEAGGDILLVVAQTDEVHEEVARLLRALHERNLAEFAAGRPVLRVHRVADAAARRALVAGLADRCNAALADAADAKAEVGELGESLTVLSASPEFHALAAQVIAAVAGVAEPPPGRDADDAEGAGAAHVTSRACMPGG